MLSNLKRYIAFLIAHSTYVWIIFSIYIGVRHPMFLLSLLATPLIGFLVNSVCFRMTSFIRSKYGTIYYRLIPDAGDYYIRTYKYRYGVFVKERDSRNLTLTLDEERDIQTIKDTVINTKEKCLSKVDKKKLKERTLKSVQKRLMNNDLSIHSSDEEFLNQLKKL